MNIKLRVILINIITVVMAFNAVNFEAYCDGPGGPIEVFFKSENIDVTGPCVPHVVNCLNRNNGSKGISIKQLTPIFLFNLSGNDLRQLLAYIGKKEIKIAIKNRNGIIHPDRISSYIGKVLPSHSYHSVNAGVAVILNTYYKQGSPYLISKILSYSPIKVIKGLKGIYGYVLIPETVQLAIVRMAHSIKISDRDTANALDDSETIIQIADIVDRYLSYWAEKDPKRIEYYLRNMIDAVQYNSLQLEKRGALCGAILAGGVKTTNDIMEGDVRRIILALTIGNILSITTGLLAIPAVVAGAAPVVIAAAVVPSILSMICAAVPGIFAMRKGSIRDYRGISHEVLGAIEMSLLQQVTEANRKEIYRMLAWMRAAVHVNSSCF